MTHTRCDFCGKPFSAEAWNSRTCYACSAQGAPDQSKHDHASYAKLFAEWHNARSAERKAKSERNGMRRSVAEPMPLPSNRKTGRGGYRKSNRDAFGQHNDITEVQTNA